MVVVVVSQQRDCLHYSRRYTSDLISQPCGLISTFRSSFTVTRLTCQYLLCVVKERIMATSSDSTAVASPLIQFPALRRLSNDLIHTIIKQLDPPSAVCCALACKTGRNLVLEATAKQALKDVCPNFTPRTNSTELPLSTLISQIRIGTIDVIYAHPSDRLHAQLMLQLRNWMPEGFGWNQTPVCCILRGNEIEHNWNNADDRMGESTLNSCPSIRLLVGR